MNDDAHPIPGAWLTAYYDGELEPARRQQVEAHLLTCVECQEALAAMKALSEALTADDLPGQKLSDAATFWRKLEPRLPGRPAVSTPNMMFRWLPGISLLVLNGALQTAAVAAAILVFVLPRAAHHASWIIGVSRLATGATLGWVTWLWPTAWSGLGLFLSVLTLSTGLAVVYLAWLAYEWRYGAMAARRAVA